MNRPWFLLSFLSVLFSSCASVHPGEMGTGLTHNSAITLNVSADIDAEAETKANSLINFTFENTGDRWMRIEGIDLIVTPKQVDQISVVVGHDLQDWMDAYIEKKKMDTWNRSVWVSSLLVAGAVTSAATSNSTSTAGEAANAAGNLVMAGAAGYAIGNAIGDARHNVETVRKRDKDGNIKNETSAAFSVPPGLFLRKWMLINHPANQVLNRLVIRVRTVEGELEVYDIPLS